MAVSLIFMKIGYIRLRVLIGLIIWTLNRSLISLIWRTVLLKFTGYSSLQVISSYTATTVKVAICACLATPFSVSLTSKTKLSGHYPRSYAADQNTVSPSLFTVAHNTILWWQASPAAVFYPQYTPYSTKQIREIFHHEDVHGRRFRTKANKGRKRLFADDTKGIPMLDVWSLNVASPSQRSGYPTEKPLPLLNRIVQCSTKENDIVCDPFCGSGTTLLAARNLKRRYIGIDINNDAVLTSQKRLGVEPSENGGQNV